MDRYPYAKPPKWWSPRPDRFWMQFWRPLRRHQQRRDHRILKIDVLAMQHLRRAIRAGQGVLITPNHAGHGDCFLLLDALLQLKVPSYIMTAWQVFFMMRGWERLAYRQHGCFSVDREGRDIKAYRQAVKILAESSSPLVMFPEGEVYHLNDRVTPFRDGTLTIASSAVRRSNRPVACIPCALKYHYLDDPTPQLRKTIARIAQRLNVNISDQAPLAETVEQLLAATIDWRERQFLGKDTDGPPLQRGHQLAEEILRRREQQYRIDHAAVGIPERVKQIRQHAVQQTSKQGRQAAAQGPHAQALEDAFVAVQLYSYVPGYIRQSPTIERIAETVDKLEEDVLGVRTANIRGTRRGTIAFGPPLVIESAIDREGCRKMGGQLQQSVQRLLNDLA